MGAGRATDRSGSRTPSCGGDFPANNRIFVAAGGIIQHGEGRDFAGGAVGRGDAGEVGQVVGDFSTA